MVHFVSIMLLHCLFQIEGQFPPIFENDSPGQSSGTYGSRAICGSFHDCIWLSDSMKNLSGNVFKVEGITGDSI